MREPDIPAASARSTGAISTSYIVVLSPDLTSVIHCAPPANAPISMLVTHVQGNPAPT